LAAFCKFQNNKRDSATAPVNGINCLYASLPFPQVLTHEEKVALNFFEPPIFLLYAANFIIEVTTNILDESIKSRFFSFCRHKLRWNPFKKGVFLLSGQQRYIGTFFWLLSCQSMK